MPLPRDGRTTAPTIRRGDQDYPSGKSATSTWFRAPSPPLIWWLPTGTTLLYRPMAAIDEGIKFAPYTMALGGAQFTGFTSSWMRCKTRTASAAMLALGLLGSLVLIAFILKMGERHQLAVRIPAITDNQGTVFSMVNNKTGQMPTAPVLMQLVLALHQGGALLAFSHVKRDLNQWADDLTYANPLEFHPE